MNSFLQLTDKLVSASILALYDKKAETQLLRDASTFGFRAILFKVTRCVRNKNPGRYVRSHPQWSAVHIGFVIYISIEPKTYVEYEVNWYKKYCIAVLLNYKMLYPG